MSLGRYTLTSTATAKDFDGLLQHAGAKAEIGTDIPVRLQFICAKPNGSGCDEIVPSFQYQKWHERGATWLFAGFCLTALLGGFVLGRWVLPRKA